MTNKQELLQSLTEILEAARAKDKDKIMELDPLFDDLLHKVFPEATSERNQYDTCRQSCVTGLTLFPDLYDTCLNDAEERYAKLINS